MAHDNPTADLAMASMTVLSSVLITLVEKGVISEAEKDASVDIAIDALAKEHGVGDIVLLTKAAFGRPR